MAHRVRPRDVDRLIGELAQLVRVPGSAGEVTLGVRTLVDTIRSSRSRTTHRGGYDEEEVDKFLDRIMDSLLRGERGTLWHGDLLSGRPGMEDGG